MGMYDLEMEHLSNRLKRLGKMADICECPYVKRNIQWRLLKETEYLQYLHALEYSSEAEVNVPEVEGDADEGDISRSVRAEIELSIEELKAYDGKGGKPAYAAIDGVIYDVSMEPAWGGGTHFGLYSGNDLTEQFKRCHAGEDIVKKLKRVGTLK